MTAARTAGMAKKKARRNTENWNIKPIIMTMRGSAEFKAWVERAAKADRSSVAMFFERAAVHYARAIGFNDPPPER